MVFTGLLYLAFILSEIGKLFLDNFIFLYCLDNTLEIYFDNFFEVARKNGKMHIFSQGTCFCAFRNWVTCQK